MDMLFYQIALTKIPRVGPRLAKNLISYCGGVREIFKASARDLRAIPGVGERIARHIRHDAGHREAERELRFIEQHHIQTHFFLDDTYPFRLKPYPDCPILLYYRGSAALNHYRTVAVVGTRRPNDYGLQACERLIGELQDYDVQVISGLAYGVDIAAHRRCLESSIPTIGVLGHGLGRIYPQQHRRVAQQMLEKGGLLTEYSSQTGPEREHFPMRNRLIAGLCDALLVIQTAEKGGSMISADLANHYHKEVFALPGRVGDPQSRGCNQLIKSHRAQLFESVADVAVGMGWDSSAPHQVQQRLFPELSREEQCILGVLSNREVSDIDQLQMEAKIGSSQLAALLLGLEFKGVIRPLPGKRYAMLSGKTV
ncbi:MAG: DNA-processing protein DprA [Bacteroidota bacterium]